MELLNSSDSSSNIRYNHLALSFYYILHHHLCAHPSQKGNTSITSWEDPSKREGGNAPAHEFLRIHRPEAFWLPRGHLLVRRWAVALVVEGCFAAWLLLITPLIRSGIIILWGAVRWLILFRRILKDYTCNHVKSFVCHAFVSTYVGISLESATLLTRWAKKERPPMTMNMNLCHK